MGPINSLPTGGSVQPAPVVTPKQATTPSGADISNKASDLVPGTKTKPGSGASASELQFVPSNITNLNIKNNSANGNAEGTALVKLYLNPEAMHPSAVSASVTDNHSKNGQTSGSAAYHYQLSPSSSGAATEVFAGISSDPTRFVNGNNVNTSTYGSQQATLTNSSNGALLYNATSAEELVSTARSREVTGQGTTNTESGVLGIRNENESERKDHRALEKKGLGYLDNNSVNQIATSVTGQVFWNPASGGTGYSVDASAHKFLTNRSKSDLNVALGVDANVHGRSGDGTSASVTPNVKVTGDVGSVNIYGQLGYQLGDGQGLAGQAGVQIPF